MVGKFIFALCLLHLMAQIYACSCVPENILQSLCNSDFVSLVEIQERKSVGKFEVTYIVKHKTVFLKNSEFAKSSNTSLLKTSNDASTCGVLLELQKRPEENIYLLSGRVIERGAALHLGLCTSIALPWHELHVKDRAFLEEKGNLAKLCATPNLESAPSGLPPSQIFVGLKSSSRIRRNL